ncbi:MAG: crossover junction endodeoxyribonuclease RuvC [Alphaproteobacteria bacterium]|jgi:crossover junction endodeoxyribonuclease RuvC
MIILGIDPGLQRTGWGVISFVGNRLKHIDNGVIKTDSQEALAKRLVTIEENLKNIIDIFKPQIAAVEQIFSNKDAVATIKLAQARAMALFATQSRGVQPFEYAPNTVKKTVVGQGHADKKQVQHMLSMLFPAAKFKNADAADALAIAVTGAYLARPVFV